MVAQLVGADKDEGVNAFLQLVDARQSLQLAATAFALHWHGDDAHGENAFLLGHLGHHRSSTCSRATTHTSGDKQHLGIVVHQCLNLVTAHFGSFTADVGVVACTQLALAEVNRGLHTALQQGLVVGVAEYEVDALDAFLHHVVDGITTTATDTDDFDIVGFLHVNRLEQLVLCVWVHHVIFCHSVSVF